MKTVIKKRSDYRPLYWMANETLLEIFIYEKFTIVKSKISFKKNNDHVLKSFKLDSNLELNGENLTTKKFQVIIDKSEPINIEIEKIKKINDTHIIPIPSRSISVNIISEVKIFPIKNTSLENMQIDLSQPPSTFVLDLLFTVLNSVLLTLILLFLTSYL